MLMRNLQKMLYLHHGQIDFEDVPSAHSLRFSHWKSPASVDTGKFFRELFKFHVRNFVDLQNI